MNLHRRALGRAGASYFFSQKSNQKGLQQKGFFALKAFALQTGQNHGLQLFCPASHPLFLPFCKNLLCPFHHTCPPSFCPLSPEADLLRKSILFELGIVSIDTFFCLPPY
ncbi:hypothetical protein ACEN9X_03515 [Mucilaginibacter sp. Mucisp86]|uniref:hypothetical protein n=1 Tax=Mucilaginibacter sp. Mucisp86 TaxID=3243060 RepID=UPI0039B69F0E